MLNILALALGDYQTNTYIVHNSDSKECVIIDPGYEAEVILAKLEALALKPAAILLTHGHFDHVGAVEEIVEATGCDLWMNRLDWELPISPMYSYLYPLANSDFAEVRFCKDGDAIQVAGLTFEVLSTPGHTAGSVCYACGDALFSGDTLFAGSCGRTDLPGGDWGNILQSLGRLSSLGKDLRVFPGHGESTTLAQEKRYNPYMK
jgi:glyoxylase-like metal-dependent hydrolase (beta-lactamase superfamily II)